MSLWYTAHLLMYVRRKNRQDGPIPVWENLVLVKGDSESEAFAKAERRGKRDEGDDEGTFRWAGEPAEWVFAGVRKLTLCEDPEKRPGDGDEISYLELEVDSERSIRDLLAGKSTAVKLHDSAAQPQKQNGHRWSHYRRGRQRGWL